MTASNMRARAFASPGVALLALKSPAKIPGLAGWAIKRKNVTTGEETWLNSMVPFKGQSNPNWESRPTTEWPIQKLVWKDFQAPAHTKLQWGFTPVFFDATKASGVRCDESQVTWTNEVVLTTDLDDEISIAFTNGILSTQWLAHQVPKKANGEFDFDTLVGWLNTPKNAIRVRQAGDALPLLMSAIQQARAEGGRVHLVLYEFTDPELVALVIANADIVTIILGNTGKDDAENQPTRVKLKAAGVTVIDRFVTGEAIPHNKFVIYEDRTGTMMYIIGGSTNWTTTGLTCQANTAIRVKSTNLAKLYKKYHDLLQADSKMKPTQSAWLRARLAIKPPIVVLKSGARIQVFFTPNTRERSKPKGEHPLPIDRAFGSMVFRRTMEALTALFFQPGHPSYLDDIRWLSANKPDMSILEVAVSSYAALEKDDTLLHHRPGQPPVAVVASAIEKAFGVYIAEILKLPDAHAIIHTKAAEGDARHKSRWMVWVKISSHNGGDTASFKNDENVLFIFGHRALAIAVMVNHMDVTDHYRFRAMVNQNLKNDSLQGFLSQDDTWQDKYFEVNGAPMRELDYLTRDDEPEEDGPIPDFLQEDSDPKAFDNWGNKAADWEAEATAEEQAEIERTKNPTEASSSEHEHAKPETVPAESKDKTVPASGNKGKTAPADKSASRKSRGICANMWHGLRSVFGRKK
jgi:type II secretory pathway pseudopilin PulG